MGLREFSMQPAALLDVREQILALDTHPSRTHRKARRPMIWRIGNPIRTARRAGYRRPLMKQENFAPGRLHDGPAPGLHAAAAKQPRQPDARISFESYGVAPQHETRRRFPPARLQDILASGAVRGASRLLRSLAPAKSLTCSSRCRPAEREIIWNLVDETQDGEILLLVTEEVRAQLIRHMDAEELLAATENLDLDDLADLVQQMPSAITAQVMDALDDQRRHRLQAVLSYPEDTAGGLMNTDTVTVRPEVTLDVVLRYLRRLGDGVPTSTDKLFVVNRDDNYLGILPVPTGDAIPRTRWPRP